jgi:cytochrome c peroxidase
MKALGLVLLAASFAASAADATRLNNDRPFANPSGNASSYGKAGEVDLTGPFFMPQGANGRACASCHLPEAGWSIRPADVEQMFEETAGTHPIFNRFDANTPTPDASSLESLYASYSMLRAGLFRRGGALPATAEFEIVAVDDPLGTGASFTNFQFFRRPLATANFHIAKNVGWHDQSTNGSGNVHAGLVSQAANNVVTGQEGPPAAPETVDAMVAFEESLSFAQRFVAGAGKVDACGGRGGAELLSATVQTAGRFDLFDAWAEGVAQGPCAQGAPAARRAQVARGQEIFNAVNANGRSCLGCHNAANNGSNVNGTLFDVGVSRAELRMAGMPLFTVRNKATGATRQTTDPGRAVRSGRWADMDRFKVPSLRGLAARPPYFHNGIAATIEDAVRHYEAALGFQYDDDERAALAAFLEAL